MIKIVADNMIHAYNAHFFCGHSPIAQAASTKKFRIDHARFSVANAILNLLAQIKGKANKRIFIMPIYNINLPGWPKLVSNVCHSN